MADHLWHIWADPDAYEEVRQLLKDLWEENPAIAEVDYRGAQ